MTRFGENFVRPKNLEDIEQDGEFGEKHAHAVESGAHVKALTLY